jgi:RNA polymerase sigma-70 factor (ECF subfamily)
MINTLRSTGQYTDAEVIQRVVSGETALFELLIRRNNPLLHKIGMSYGYSHEDTQDLMQETFVSAYLNLSKFQNRSAFKTWIIRIMLNNCYSKRIKLSYANEKAKEINEKSIPMFSDDKRNDLSREVANRELSHLIENALLQVPMDYRMVFTLREVNGLSVAEAAEALDISEANVKVRLNRAKAMLRKELEKSYSSEEIFDFNLVYCDKMVERVMNEIATLA